MNDKILILDKPEDIPYIDNFIQKEIVRKYNSGNETLYELIYEPDEEVVATIAKEYYEERKYPLPIFSFEVNKVNRLLDSIDSVTPLYITKEKSEFKESYEEFKSKNKFTFLPKIYISSTKEIDLLEVSNLFSKSSEKKLKYINGDSTPVIIDYEGMDTFNYISKLKSGVLVPATEYDIKFLDSPNTVVSKPNIVVQIDEEGKYYGAVKYKLCSNKEFGIVWTDIKEHGSKEIKDLIKNLDLPESLNCAFYLELEKHKDTLFINKVIQGLHPYIYYNL